VHFFAVGGQANEYVVVRHERWLKISDAKELGEDRTLDGTRWADQDRFVLFAFEDRKEF
jgi:hypothetical protein